MAQRCLLARQIIELLVDCQRLECLSQGLLVLAKQPVAGAEGQQAIGLAAEGSYGWERRRAYWPAGPCSKRGAHQFAGSSCQRVQGVDMVFEGCGLSNARFKRLDVIRHNQVVLLL